ncbi:hypothetical protein DFH09DRAFT_1321142 [Mycena vulgaris]|nr:hypothetical protein DFH09DRAFT_1321142 [Mycena vulgaris]
MGPTDKGSWSTLLRPRPTLGGVTVERNPLRLRTCLHLATPEPQLHRECCPHRLDPAYPDLPCPRNASSTRPDVDRSTSTASDYLERAATASRAAAQSEPAVKAVEFQGQTPLGSPSRGSPTPFSATRLTLEGEETFYFSAWKDTVPQSLSARFETPLSARFETPLKESGPQTPRTYEVALVVFEAFQIPPFKGIPEEKEREVSTPVLFPRIARF